MKKNIRTLTNLKESFQKNAKENERSNQSFRKFLLHVVFKNNGDYDRQSSETKSLVLQNTIDLLHEGNKTRALSLLKRLKKSLECEQKFYDEACRNPVSRFITSSDEKSDCSARHAATISKAINEIGMDFP